MDGGGVGGLGIVIIKGGLDDGREVIVWGMFVRRRGLGKGRRVFDEFNLFGDIVGYEEEVGLFLIF